MDQQQYFDIALYIGSAWLAGAAIGIERDLSGHSAGLRTHALVCMASALLMIVSTHQWDWLGTVPLETVRTDPTRVAQGIMTGIGFLGAGVIFKDGLTVRGLTTAASIWMTAAIGILYGVGFFYPAVLATVMTLITLTVILYLGQLMPVRQRATLNLTYPIAIAPDEKTVRALVKEHGIAIKNLSFERQKDGALVYAMMLGTREEHAFSKLAETLRGNRELTGYMLIPRSD